MTEYSFVRWAIALTIVLIHVALVPIAIWITLRMYGFQNALTIENQTTWTPIMIAQSGLLAIWFAFGGSRSIIRVGLFLLGSAYLGCSVVWAYSMLTHFEEPFWQTCVAQFHMTATWLLLPLYVSAIALLPFRSILGSIGGRGQKEHQFCIADLLLLTLLSALVFVWWRHLVTAAYQIVSFEYLWTSALQGAACSLGVTLVVFTRRLWVFGILITGVTLYWQWSMYQELPFNFSWFRVLAPWLIVAVTLLAFRLSGCKLQFAPASDKATKLPLKTE